MSFSQFPSFGMTSMMPSMMPGFSGQSSLLSGFGSPTMAFPSAGSDLTGLLSGLDSMTLGLLGGSTTTSVYRPGPQNFVIPDLSMTRTIQQPQPQPQQDSFGMMIMMLLMTQLMGLGGKKPVKPCPSPMPIDCPVPTPSPVPVPTPTPVPVPTPTPVPVPTPTPVPVPTPTPVPVPTPTPVPVPVPVPVPTPAPCPCPPNPILQPGSGKFTISTGLNATLKNEPKAAKREAAIQAELYKAAGIDPKAKDAPRLLLNKLYGINIKAGPRKNAASAALLQKLVKSIDAQHQQGLKQNKVICEFDLNNCKPEAVKITKLASPIVLDLDGNGIGTSEALIKFNIDGQTDEDGPDEELNDIAQGDAILVFDADGDGISGEDGKEMFGQFSDIDKDGNPDNFEDGYQALQALANKAKQQGLINDDDNLDANELAALEREFGLKIKRGSLTANATSLSEAGITNIKLSNGQKTMIENFDNQENALLKQEGASFTLNGNEQEYSDIFFLAL